MPSSLAPTTRPLRLLLLSHAFNSLTQRLFVELRARGHELSVELDIADGVTEEAVAMFAPDVVIAPFLKRRIPATVWQRVPCLVVHPGVVGDRGPAALDRAILRGDSHGGVTVLQAVDDFDAGPVWASVNFPMRAAPKGSLYRQEVTEAAAQAVILALQRIAAGEQPQDPGPTRWWPAVPPAERAIDWAQDDSATVLRKIRSADGHPGLQTRLFGQDCRVFDAHPAATGSVRAVFADLRPGQAMARRGPALLCRTVDGAVWIGHVREIGPTPQPASPLPLKLPATEVFRAQAAALPELPVALQRNAATGQDEWDELRYEESGPVDARVGLLHFGFHNGAMSIRQCERLRDALRLARGRNTQVLVLLGGEDFFSSGIHLNAIEAAAAHDGDSAADASWRNIEAMNDVVLEILTMDDRLTVAALRGNAGAGGVFLALAADEVWAHPGVVLNPHYRNMGNLHGSEYWTYVLPLRVGPDRARAIVQDRLPLGARQAAGLGLVDACFGTMGDGFLREVRNRACELALHNAGSRVRAKRARRAADEAHRPLAAYRADELAQMHRNFYGFDPSYHVARYHFVHKLAHAWTPRHLAVHR